MGCHAVQVGEPTRGHSGTSMAYKFAVDLGERASKVFRQVNGKEPGGSYSLKLDLANLPRG